jgi:hypothetical protein
MFFIFGVKFNAMFLRVEVKKGTNEELFAAKLMKQKEVVNVKVSKPKKKKEEAMTDYFANGKQLSVKEFKARIAAAEADVKAGRVYTPSQLREEMETWKKQKGYK